jgi:hypothetical protein
LVRVGIILLCVGVEFVGRGPLLLEVRYDYHLLSLEPLNFIFSDDQVVVQSIHLAADCGELVKLVEVPGRCSVEKCLGSDQILDVVRTEGCGDHVAATRRICLHDDELCAIFEGVLVLTVFGQGGLELLYAPLEIVDLTLDALHLLKTGFKNLVSIEQCLESLFFCCFGVIDIPLCLGGRRYWHQGNESEQEQGQDDARKGEEVHTSVEATS